MVSGVEDTTKPNAEVIDLIESKAQRDELAGRIGVLEKVRKLLLLPNMEFATTRQVAEYYEVQPEVIRQIHVRHLQELKEDGHITMTGKSLAEKLVCEVNSHTTVSKGNGHLLLKYDGHETQLPYATVGLYPKRSILRIGMLLRDSEVAREVRTQLLNLEEKAEASTKIAEINKEEELTTEAVRAMMAGDVQGLAIANAKLVEYKNRHIKKVEAKLNEVTKERDELSETVSAFIESDETYTMGEVGEEIDGLSAQALRDFLQTHGVLAQKSRGEVYRPIGKYKGMKWFTTLTKKSKWSDFTYTHTYITTKGRKEITELYNEVMQAQEINA
ncbi:hypothetical protein FNE58_07165 [Bacillus thuringiensis]|uniref:Antirepressor protein C-terminal domain-containing protein n=2 Tax=Bacillus TaxID=1386 RepID=A0A9X6KSU0_BACTU|nr:hypothetical protein FPG93_01655 [Bacillus thuringiensis]KMP91967.1 hypothetical protein TU66_34480 [Bacillus cereus]OIX23058.1 hypothetical protein BMT18_01675 [Bacillus thuringiensis serovar aizawai]MDR5039341.1 hypothetical protein [Bacillus thuringiensis]OTY77002.1 hypothetical protein BK755_33100 [Bacillus thuringiensis serovar aizawai]